ncbi:MAG TPA: PxKF domain-containing protein [Vicinamibacterales bacterium]|nr:PxKF domain-containing protein [Vicinamibacterales bacterium]
MSTDSPAYVAGELVTATGRDFVPGESVTLQVTHADGTAEPGMGHEPTTAVVGSDGSFQFTWTPNGADIAGPQLLATVSGNASGDVAPATFARIATVSSDKGDYQPGDTAVITGFGFAPNEPVQLQVVHANGQTDGNGHQPFYATADASGAIVTTWFVDPDDSVGSRFVITAIGVTSSVTGTTSFWDAGSISLTTLGTPYTQNFDTLASAGTSSTMPNGWDFVETGTNANTTYTAGTGSSNAGDTYSFGALSNTERALGTLLSGSLVSRIGAQFTNNTGSVITALAIAYTGEMWRLGQNTAGRAPDRLDFQFSTDATSVNTGTWTDVNALDFSSPVVAGTVGALVGNNDPNRTALAFTITGVRIPVGGAFWIRWVDFDLAPGADDGLAIDDFSLTPFVIPVVTITAPDASAFETGPDSGTFRIARTGSTANALDVTYTVGGTASNADYTPALSGTATIPAGQPSVDVTITPVDDGLVEDSETVVLTLVDTVDYDLGASTTATVRIGDDAPTVASTVPANGASNVAVDQNITVTFSEAVNVTGSWFSVVCSTSGAHTAVVTGGPTAFVINPDVDFASGESCTLTVIASAVTDQDGHDPPDNMTVNFTAGFTAVVLVPIHNIQGASHMSPLNGQTLTTVPSIVTALRTAGSTRGFYIQDLSPDASDATSEGVFVFTGGSSNPASMVTVGDIVRVGGRVSEFRPASDSLTITELVAPLSISKLSSGNALPAPIVIGAGGRTPPAMVIEDDASGDAETSGVFDPVFDGIDFYESLEGMLVRVNDVVAVGPTSDFGSNREIPIVVDGGVNASVRTTRGGIVIRPNDFNPERIILNDWIAGGPTLPAVNVGASYPGATTGVMDYSFGNFKLQVISLPLLSAGSLQPETTTTARADQLAVATFNVENLAPTDPPAKFARLAGLIVNNLKAPDVLAIEEIQDNNGTTNNGTVSATTTWSMLIAAIQVAGGPTYDYRQIDPVDGQDGGAPGGNIRQGFLFRTDRGLSFVDRPGGGSTIANAVVGAGVGTQLLYSPGRIEPTNAAFNASRKPLAGEFVFRGRHLFLVANHFNSKGGDNPLFGRFQPTVRISEAQRHQQAQITHDFINAIVSADPNADVIVMGDLNDFEFSDTVSILKGTPGILEDLIDTLPASERYSYVFEGNSQTLDHILFSTPLFNAHQFDYDVVHVNSEFADQASDHDPQVARITIFDISEFFQPVDNLPTLNVVNAGRAIPVKFSLGGDEGLNIFAAGYPRSEEIPCDSSVLVAGIEETVTAGASSLSFDASTGRYNYIWKTDKAWAGTCRQLVVKFIEGTSQRANFKFGK